MLDQIDYDHYQINHPRSKIDSWGLTFLVAGCILALGFVGGAYYGRTHAIFICPIEVRLA